MNIDFTRLFAAANFNTEHRVSHRILITQIGVSVDAITGLPATVDTAVLRERSAYSIARYLLEHFAGDVVFVVVDMDDTYIIRPPFSEIEVYYLNGKDSMVLWSGSSLPCDVQLGELNWKYLHGALLSRVLVTPQTAFIDILELLSGAILICKAGSAAVQNDCLPGLVKNLHHCVTTFDATRDLCRELMLASVSHKTIDHEGRVSVAVSGGLDSSVVAIATSLCHPAHELPLINVRRLEDDSSDERPYFDILTQSISNARAEHIEVSVGASRVDLSPELFDPAPRPSKMAGAGVTNSRIHRRSEELGCTRLLTGDGGDQLFLRLSHLNLARDLIAECSTWVDRFRCLIQIAACGHRSVWDVLRAVREPVTESNQWRHMFGDLAFPLSSIAGCVRFQGEKIHESQKISNWQLSMAHQYLALRSAETNRMPLANSSVSERKPSIFWPLIRVCITAPRRFHNRFSVDRAIERALFDELPTEIMNRSGKGGGSDVSILYDYQRLSARLLDSELCDRGLLDRTALKRIIQSNAPDEDTNFAIIRASAIYDWMNSVRHSS
jgi:asparagine synthetase B (glutamine-hydrolysing)